MRPYFIVRDDAVLPLPLSQLGNWMYSRLLPANSLNHTFKKTVAEKRILFQLGFSYQGGGAPLPVQILAGQRPGRAPMSYDSLYPSFRSAAPARNRLGRKLCRGHFAAMPRL